MSYRHIKKVLCSVDFSDYSMDTLRESLEISHRFQAELLILNVVNQRMLDELQRYSGRIQALNDIAETAYQGIAEDREGDLKRLMQQLLDAGVPVDEVKHSTRITLGLPFEKIIEVATEFDADLIIMGAKGRTALTRHVRFGGTAEKVFRRADRPVLFVR